MKSTTLTTLIAAAFLSISSAVFAAPVNINTASAVELAEALNGVGESKAKAIVQFREANGSFTSAEQIVEVKGIGQSTFEKNMKDILVN